MTIIKSCFAAGLIVAAASLAQAEAWGPWSATSESPVILTAADREFRDPLKLAPDSPAMASVPFIWLIRFHQKVISPIDGDRCSMYPTCSQYGIEAIQKHGPLMGGLLTLDRLMHEHDERGFSREIRKGSRTRVYDPVENNDFWWAGR